VKAADTIGRNREDLPSFPDVPCFPRINVSVCYILFKDLVKYVTPRPSYLLTKYRAVQYEVHEKFKAFP